MTNKQYKISAVINYIYLLADQVTKTTILIYLERGQLEAAYNYMLLFLGE